MNKLLFLTLLLMVLPLPASAEQPAAEQYRQMFRLGNFYVEYQVINKTPWTFTDQGLMYSTKKLPHEIRAGRYGQRIAKTGIKDKYPNALYRDGKYYRFTKVEEESSNIITGSSKKLLRNAYVLKEDRLYSPILDPDENWQTVREDLCLPYVFAVFFLDDPMNDYSQSSPRPIFNGSSRRELDGKEYDCDQYLTDIKSMAGTIIAQEAFNMFYDGGKLVRIQKYLLRNGEEFLIEDLLIYEISAQVPDEAFKIHKKFKLYAARNGDMNDLLNDIEQIGEIGGSAQ